MRKITVFLIIISMSCYTISQEMITGKVKTNNDDPAILYFGNWNTTLDASGFYGKDYKASNTQYNKCLFTFRGPAVVWVGSKNNNHGLADVYINNQFQKTIDSYNPTFKQIQYNTKPYALPSEWKPVSNVANAPANGVTLQSGVIKDVFTRNINNLNHCFASPTYCDGEGWSKWLPASNEGRMLTGAANTLRWGERNDMRNIVNTIIKNIKNRVRADGYHNYYPESESFTLNSGTNSERKNYDRVFWTRGLMDAGKAGSSEAYAIARNFYNWFNVSPYLPDMLQGFNATNGLPGGGLIYHSPVGTPDDLVTTEKYFDQDYWIDELKNGQPLGISDYPGINPHCYELLGIEAFIDEYKATGLQKYIDAVKGGWEIYYQNFEHIGGSTAICESAYFPPKSYYVNSHTGELCGSVFWTNVNSKLLQLYPNEEKYAAEIEKSIYNVLLAAQDTNGFIRYHQHLHGTKENTACANTCCEVSSTGMISKLPEYIYSIAKDGLFVNLFVSSTITWSQGGSNITLSATTSFPENPDVAMTIATASKKAINIRIRVPSWAGREMVIYVNGKPAATGNPGTYVSLNRKWSDNDKISFSLPMSLTTVKYTGIDQVDGNMDRYALLYGPILMALQGPLTGPGKIPQITTTAADLPGLLTSVTGSPLRFTVKGYPSYKYVPYWQVSETFTCFPIIQP